MKLKLLGWIVLIILLFVLGILFAYHRNVFASTQDKLNICHLTSSETNPWVTQQINANELQSHLANGDFLYNGPLKSNGHPENANHQDSLWCADHAPHHYACIENACSRVEGAGNSTCEVNSDCQEFIPQTHSVCRANACVVVEGQGDSTCKVDKDCEEPTPTPEPNPQPSSTAGSSGSVEAPRGPECVFPKKGLENFWVDQGVPGDGKVTLRYWPLEGTDTLQVEYGLEKDHPLWGATVQNTGSNEIGDLPRGQHVWYRIGDGCNKTPWFDPTD